jgi:soluble lytic murein transglycosylase-like protein
MITNVVVLARTEDDALALSRSPLSPYTAAALDEPTFKDLTQGAWVLWTSGLWGEKTAQLVRAMADGMLVVWNPYPNDSVIHYSTLNIYDTSPDTVVRRVASLAPNLLPGTIRSSRASRFLKILKIRPVNDEEAGLPPGKPAGPIHPDAVTSGSPQKGDLALRYAERIASMRAIIRREAILVGLDPRIALAVAWVESRYDPNEINRSTQASGLMGLIPATYQLYRLNDPLDPRDNAKAGVTELKRYSIAYKGDLDRVLGAYHAGPHNIERRGFSSRDLAYIAAVRQAMSAEAAYGERP